MAKKRHARGIGFHSLLLIRATPLGCLPFVPARSLEHPAAGLQESNADYSGHKKSRNPVDYGEFQLSLDFGGT